MFYFTRNHGLIPASYTQSQIVTHFIYQKRVRSSLSVCVGGLTNLVAHSIHVCTMLYQQPRHADVTVVRSYVQRTETAL